MSTILHDKIAELISCAPILFYDLHVVSLDAVKI